MTDINVPTIVTVSSSRSRGGEIETGPDVPNIYIKVMAPITIIGVRALRVFLQSLIGLVTAGLAAPTALPTSDFLHLLTLCASLSVAPTVISIVQNVIELLAAFDQSHPQLTV